MEISKPYNSAMIQRDLKSENEQDKKLKEACEDFEALFTGLMLKTMRSTVPEDSLFGSNNQKEIFQSMFDQEIANTIAHSDNNVGIGDMLYQKLSRDIQKISGEKPPDTND